MPQLGSTLGGPSHSLPSAWVRAIPCSASTTEVRSSALSDQSGAEVFSARPPSDPTSRSVDEANQKALLAAMSGAELALRPADATRRARGRLRGSTSVQGGTVATPASCERAAARSTVQPQRCAM